MLQAAVFADASKLKLGQSVIRIGGKNKDAVGIGTVSALPDGTRAGDFIEASVSSATPGNILTTIFGEIVGMTTVESLAYGDELYTPSISARALLTKKMAQ